MKSTGIMVGLCDSGRSAWFFDRSVIEITRDQKILFSYPVRITGLLVKDLDWQLAAAFWSIPLRNNDYQYDLIMKGKLKTGTPTGENISPEAQPLAQSIINAMAQPLTKPDLYSTREDAITIGSTVDEVFRAEDGKNWVGEIVQLPLKFAVRGGIRGAVSPDGGTAWMATHIDLTGGITMPYRFFYVWLREPDGWKIVVSHDAVSIDPTNLGFEAP
jgi:hypothetical protein